VHDAIAGEKYVIADFDVATEQRAVGEDDVVTQLTVVTDMSRRHEEIIVAYRGRRSIGRAAMDLNMLADDIAITDA